VEQIFFFRLLCCLSVRQEPALVEHQKVPPIRIALPPKQWTSFKKKLVMDEHSSLFRFSVGAKEVKFYGIATVGEHSG